MAFDLARLRPRTPTRKALLYHAMAGLGALIVVGLVGTGLTHRLAQQEALRDANWSGHSIAVGLIAPLLTPGVRAGQPDDLAILDRLARSRIASGTVVRVKVWSADGTVIYSDATGLIGRRFDLGPDEVAVLHDGGLFSDETSHHEPENVYERDMGELIEVYAQARDTDGHAVLVESYFPITEIDARAAELAGRMLPVVLLALVLLDLLLLPLSVWLSRRAERAERERLLAQQDAVEAAADERRRLAGELHDGVLQDLTTVTYSLYVATRELEDRGADDVQAVLDQAAEMVRADMVTLRGLTISSYTTQVTGSELSAAISALVATMAGDGVRAGIDPLPVVSDQAAAAVFQIARESLRNALRHAGTPPRLELRIAGPDLVLTVSDTGRGYDPAGVGGPQEGHLGLSLLRDAARRAGGRLSIRTGPGAGTVVSMSLDLEQAVAGRSPRLSALPELPPGPALQH